MEAKALTPVDLFGGRVCYEIPPFQRPYVWTEEDQWQPLWDDIARVAAATKTVARSRTLGEMPEEELVKAGIRPGLVRMSIGYTGALEQSWLQLRSVLERLGLVSRADPG